MNLRRILAVIERDLRLTLRLKWRLVETLYFPITNVILWGFFTIWTQNLAIEAAFTLLAINMFWTFAYQSQSGSNQQMMEDRWTQSYPQILTTPLRPTEYLIGKTFFGVVFTGISFLITLILAHTVFDYTIFIEHFNLFLILSVITIIASVSLTILVASIINVLGVHYAFLSWSAMQLVVLFSAPFFPLTIYPPVLQAICKFVPYTWVFESIRMVGAQGFIHTSFLLKGLGLSILYLAIAVPIYYYTMDKARKSGKLVKIW